jgi:hypothetical protein
MVLALFLLVWITHTFSPNATPFDSRWTVHTALSILREGNTDLDEYRDLLAKDGFYGIECVGADGRRTYPVRRQSPCAPGHLYNFYPVAVPLLALPAVFVADKGLAVAQPWLRPLIERTPAGVRRTFLEGNLAGSSVLVEILIASLIIAAATVVVYYIAREFLPRIYSVVLGLLFAFCTPAWSTASRGLWQHGPSMLMLAIALLLVLRAERRPALIRFAGVPLLFAFFVRPTNIVPLAALSLFVLVHHRRRFVSYLLWAAPVALLFVAYDWAVYGSVLAPYFFTARPGAPGLALHPRIFEALLGNWISPARGLLTFVPVFLLSIYGMLLAPPSTQAKRLRWYLAVIVALHWVLISLYEDWWGGHSFGPRYFSDMTPYFVYFLIPVVGRSRAGLWSLRKVALASVFVVLTAASLFVHYQGAMRWTSYAWNVEPVDINRAPSRLWDWKDPPFLRSMRR